MRHTAFDVLVIGAGPAGLAAATRAAESAAHVALVDDNALPGGQIWRAGLQGPAAEARSWTARARRAGVSFFTQTRVVAALGDGVVLADTGDTALELAGRRIVLATGARERFLPFPGWTLPGVVGVGGLQALVQGGLPIAGKRVLVAGTGPLVPAVGAHLARQGGHIVLLAEQAPLSRLAAFALRVLREPPKLAQAATFARALHDVPLRSSAWVVRAHGLAHLEAATVHTASGLWTTRCDYLACAFGLVPNLELPHAFGCRLVDDHVHVDHWQRTSVDSVFCAGELTGIGGLDRSLVEGQIAGLAATGQWQTAHALFTRRARMQRFAVALAQAFEPRPELRALPAAETILCRCEDVPCGDVSAYTNWREAKLQTRCGMGPCQGRVCGAASRFLFGWRVESTRPPLVPVSLATLAPMAE